MTLTTRFSLSMGRNHWLMIVIAGAGLSSSCKGGGDAVVNGATGGIGAGTGGNGGRGGVNGGVAGAGAGIGSPPPTGGGTPGLGVMASGGSIGATGGWAGAGGVAAAGGVTMAGAGGSAGRVAGGASGGNADAGMGGGTANPCSTRAGLRFCDDFEKAAGALTAPWTVQLNGVGTVAIDSSTPAHSGTRSVHVRGGDNDFDTLFVFHDTSILPAPNGRFFMRAFMRLGRPMSDKHNTFIIADLAAMPGGGNVVRISEDYGMLMYTVMGDAHGALSNQAYYNDHKPGVVFAPMTWVCLEALFDHGGPELDVWVDGVEVPDLHHTDFPLDSYDSLRFGFEKYGGPALDIWYDDIAIGTARIGCD